MREHTFIQILLLLLMSHFTIGCQPKESSESEANNNDSNYSQPVSVDLDKKSVRPEEWSYEGERAPNNWGKLSPVYSLCGSGKSQSPINITEHSKNDHHSWSFKYDATDLHIAHNEHMEEIIDNGHTIQVTVDNGSHFIFNETEYELKQFHFHTPSEHTIDGKNLPMEAHFVHQSSDGKLAVVSILFKEGQLKNPTIAKLIEHLPTLKGEVKHPENVVLNLGEHIPDHESVYTYSGSLTTPPCSEDVQWLILSEKMEATKEQIAAFSSVIGPNNRPVQNINNRKVDVVEGNLIE